MKLSTSSVALVGLALAATATRAANFSYAQRDLIVTFQKSGSQDMEINLGSINNYRVGAATPGQVFDFSSGAEQKYDITTQLLGNFGSVNGLTFSAMATQRTTTGGVSGQNNWLWMTKARTDISSQSTPAVGYSNSQASGLQGSISSIMGDPGLTTGATAYAPLANYTIAPVSSTTVLIIPTSGSDAANAHSFTTKSAQASGLNSRIPPDGSFYNTTSGSTTFVSDLYELPSNTSGVDGIYLGKISFTNTGALTFTAVPEPSTYATVCAAALLVSGLWMRRRSQNPHA